MTLAASERAKASLFCRKIGVALSPTAAHHGPLAQRTLLSDSLEREDSRRTRVQGGFLYRVSRVRAKMFQTCLPGEDKERAEEHGWRILLVAARQGRYMAALARGEIYRDYQDLSLNH